MPRLASDLASTFATSRSGPIGSTPSFIASSRVVCTPRSVYTEANSAPITPPPITAARSGSLSAVLLVAWSDVMIRSPSTSMPGMARGTEPVHRIVARPFSVCPSTETAPSAVSFPSPMITCTLRRLSNPESPPCNCLTMPALRVLAAGQSGSATTPSGSFTPCAPAWFTVRKTSAACSSALAGMQPRCRQVPPTFSFSTRATVRPADAA